MTEITPDKWRRAKALFDAVLQQPPVNRASFLAAVCAEDDLRAQVEKLLIHHEQAGCFLSKPFAEHGNAVAAGNSETFSVFWSPLLRGTTVRPLVQLHRSGRLQSPPALPGASEERRDRYPTP
jgi:hypothetical protein